jgi:hypothetical protein
MSGTGLVVIAHAHNCVFQSTLPIMKHLWMYRNFCVLSLCIVFLGCYVSGAGALDPQDAVLLEKLPEGWSYHGCYM